MRPDATCWNLQYDAVRKILDISSKLAVVGEICDALKLATFHPTEIDLILERIAVVPPVEQSLDILQGESECNLVVVLPTLLALKGSLLHYLRLT